MYTQQSLFTHWDFFIETTSLNLTFPLFLKQTGELDFLIIFQIGSVCSHGSHLQSRRLPRKANYLYFGVGQCVLRLPRKANYCTWTATQLVLQNNAVGNPLIWVLPSQGRPGLQQRMFCLPFPFPSQCTCKKLVHQAEETETELIFCLYIFSHRQSRATHKIRENTTIIQMELTSLNKLRLFPLVLLSPGTTVF